MRSNTCPLAGGSLVILGIIHNLFGFVAGWPILREAASAGLIGEWNTPPVRGQVFWFLVAGFTLAAIGLLIARMERAGVAIPWSFIILFGLMTLTGVTLMPASGFWLLLFPVAVCLVRRLRHRHLASPTVLADAATS